MLQRREYFPNVIEMNYQARQRLGCCVYLIFDQSEWMLIDIGYEDTVPEIVELIRQMDFPLANCKYLVLTHPDVDHAQGARKFCELVGETQIVAHPGAVKPLADADRIRTFAEISAQGISLDIQPIQVDRQVDEGDVLEVGDIKIDVWHTPGHTDSQLAFRWNDLLFSGDNIFRDGGVGAIDAHHGSDIPAFIKSLQRIKDSDAKWLLPSHGPAFRKDDATLQQAIDRLDAYQHLSDFGTCAIDWPLLDEWEEELIAGDKPQR
jgi:hydroxyacylglutathione hydrolase